MLGTSRGLCIVRSLLPLRKAPVWWAVSNEELLLVRKGSFCWSGPSFCCFEPARMSTQVPVTAATITKTGAGMHFSAFFWSKVRCRRPWLVLHLITWKSTADYHLLVTIFSIPECASVLSKANCHNDSCLDHWDHASCQVQCARVSAAMCACSWCDMCNVVDTNSCCQYAYLANAKTCRSKPACESGP